MNEFNPNCGKCGMLNSRGFCSLTACRYPSNVIVVEPKVIRGMMVNPQIEKAETKADRIRAMSDEELAKTIYWLRLDALRLEGFEGQIETTGEILDWLKSPVEENE